MKKLILLTTIAIMLFVGAVSVNVYASTIFTGVPNAGVVQLRDNLQINAKGDLGIAVSHIELSGTDRLYCALPGKIAVLSPATLAHIESIAIPGEIRAMELKNGKLYVLVAAVPEYASQAAVIVISDLLLEIIQEIEVGANPSDMIVVADGSILHIARGADSRIDSISQSSTTLPKSNITTFFLL